MASHSDSKETPKMLELTDIAKAIDLLCLLNINDLRSALRTLEGGGLGVFLGDNNNKQAINIEKVASSLPRHLLAHIVMGERNFTLTHPGHAAHGWLAYTAKGLHLLNCFVSLEWHYPSLKAIHRAQEHRGCILDLLLLSQAVWNSQLSGATTFPHYVLCCEGIRLTSAALSTALQHDLDRGAESNKPKPTDLSSTISTPTPTTTTTTTPTPPLTTNPITSSNNGNHSTNNGTQSITKLPDPSTLPYSYEWYDALIIHPKIYTFTSLPMDTISLLQQVTSKALTSSPDHVPKLCRSFHTQLEAFYLMCCSEEFVGQLLLHPVFVEGELLAILQQALHLWKSPWTAANKQALTASGGIAGASAANAFQQNDPIASVVTQILRVLYVLFEKENPCFLDAVATSPRAFQHMQTIITTVTQISSRILDTDTCGPSVLESFKLIEILSDDSNFKNEVIARATPLLFQLLSLPPATLSGLFTTTPTPHTPQQLQRDFMIVVFRVVGNLHCFNEALCKPEDKGLFLRTTAAEMTKHPKTGNAEKYNSFEISPANVLANLNFLLHRLITDRQVYHLNTEELDLVTSFTESLQLSLAPSSSSDTLLSPESDNDSSTVNHKRKHTEILEVQ